MSDLAEALGKVDSIESLGIDPFVDQAILNAARKWAEFPTPEQVTRAKKKMLANADNPLAATEAVLRAAVSTEDTEYTENVNTASMEEDTE